MYNFTSQEEKEIKEFCKLNELDYDKFIKDCFDKGYQIEKYGLLTIDGQTVIEKEVIKEVIKEVPVEKIVEVEKEVIKEIEVPVEVIKEVVKEVPVEIIKEVEKIVEVEKVVEKEVINEVEVPIEVIVEKEVYITDDSETNKLLLKIEELENKPPKIIEKEIVVEKPVEIIKEVEVIKEVEIIKETENKEKQQMLQKTIQSLREDIRKKDEMILQLEKNIVELQEIKGPIKAQYMRSSNLNDNLYR
jgi:hypothetical protein